MDIKETNIVEITISGQEIEWLKWVLDKILRDKILGTDKYVFSDEQMKFYQDLFESLPY